MPITPTIDEAAAILSRSPQGTGLNSKAIAMLWDDTAKAKAFFSSRILDADILTAFRDQVSAVVSGGATSQQAIFAMQEFLRSKGDSVLRSMGFQGLEDAKASNSIGELGWTRLKLIVEQNVRMAQQATEWKKVQAQADIFPYVRYKTAEDDKVRPSHAALDGKLFKVNDPQLAAIWPPRDFNCRCWMEPVDEAGTDPVSTVSDLSADVTATPPSGYSFRPDLWDTEVQPLKPTWDAETATAVQQDFLDEIDRSAVRKEAAKDVVITPPYSIPEAVKTVPVVDAAIDRPWVVPVAPIPIPKPSPVPPPPTAIVPLPVIPPTPSAIMPRDPGAVTVPEAPQLPSAITPVAPIMPPAPRTPRRQPELPPVVIPTKSTDATRKPIEITPSALEAKATAILPELDRLIQTATKAQQANDWTAYIAAILAIAALRQTLTEPEATHGNVYP